MGKLSPLHDKFLRINTQYFNIVKVITNTGVLHRIFQNNRSNLKNKGIIIWVGGKAGRGTKLPATKQNSTNVNYSWNWCCNTHTHVLKEAACLRSIDKCSLPRAH